MLLSAVLAVALSSAPRTMRAPEPPSVRVRVDSSRHEIYITAGPYRLPSMPPGMDHAQMEQMEGAETPVQRFEWPVEGWFRGFRVRVVDSGGDTLPRALLHHMIMVSFDRRQLLYPAAERLMGAGSETADVSVPKSIGVPMKPGQKLGMYSMWHNETGKDIEGAFVQVVLLYTPKNQNPRPLDAFPLYMDVNLTVGGTNTFDVPPGKSSKSHEFVFPVGGRLLGVGGHLHDYGVSVRLEDAETGKIMVTLVGKRDAEGHLLDVPRKLFGVSGEGMKIKPGHRYRVVGEYDNPTKETIRDGAMAHIVGLFVPDDPAKWPGIDPSDTEYQKDLASLATQGGAMNNMPNMQHMKHDMDMKKKPQS